MTTRAQEGYQNKIARDHAAAEHRKAEAQWSQAKADTRIAAALERIASALEALAGDGGGA